jgi:hypothetical protein
MNTFRGWVAALLILACGGLPAAGGEDFFACEWTNIARVVAVGDVHGDFAQFVKCLTAAQLIDSSNHWAGGTAHLVQIGDTVGRGSESKKVLDLLMALEDESARAGGAVHPLLGNHELSLLKGEWDHLPPADVAAYGGAAELEKSLAPTGRYGAWLRRHNAFIRINDSVFCHAGLTRKEAGRSLRALNDEVRRALEARDGAGSAQALCWTRSLAYDREDELRETMGPILEQLGAKRFVVGHTVSKGRIRGRAGGLVILIDVGMTAVYGGPALCLVIENNRFFMVGDRTQPFDPARNAAPAEP